VALKITEGQAHDRRSAADRLSGLGAGQILLGDRAYDSDALRARMAEQGAWANVKPIPNREQVLAFSPFLYKYRNLVERFFSKIKHFRAVATRYDKDPDNFLASVKLAALRIWLRHPVLGERLRTCTAAVNAVTGRTAHQVFGSPDDMKFRSSMTLLGRADPAFKEALTRYYGGVEDPRTLGLLSDA
jgi:uncharacterized protein (DUF1810 family)